MDYCWYGTALAKTYVDKTSGFFSNIANGGVGRIFDLYNLDGTVAANAAVNSASIIGTAASGAMANTQYATFRDDAFQLVMDLLNRGEIGDRLAASTGVKSGYSYFNATVGMLMLLTMGGHMANW
jgi:hypothetical protein